ncbi:hypothetical protein [Mesorhizobium sp. 131-2-1]|nr:hypothetical protein [Mesorhizobium sp. 131-2-1]
MVLNVVGQARPNTFASKPVLSPERRREMLEALDAVPRPNPEVGAYNRTF